MAKDSGLGYILILFGVGYVFNLFGGVKKAVEKQQAKIPYDLRVAHAYPFQSRISGLYKDIEKKRKFVQEATFEEQLALWNELM